MAELHEVLTRKPVIEGLRRNDASPLAEALRADPGVSFEREALVRAWEGLLNHFPGRENRAPRKRAAEALAVHRTLRELGEREEERLREVMAKPLERASREAFDDARHLVRATGGKPGALALVENAYERMARLRADLKLQLLAARTEGRTTRSLHEAVKFDHEAAFASRLLHLQMLKLVLTGADRKPPF
jgi:hypothetical protein